jgi:hypothetical protein
MGDISTPVVTLFLSALDMTGKFGVLRGVLSLEAEIGFDLRRLLN